MSEQGNRQKESNEGQQSNNNQSIVKKITKIFTIISMIGDIITAALQGYNLYEMHFRNDKCSTYDDQSECLQNDGELQHMNYFAPSIATCQQVEELNCQNINQVLIPFISPFNKSGLKSDIIISCIAIMYLARLILLWSKNKMDIYDYIKWTSIQVITMNLLNEAIFYQTQVNCSEACGSIGFNNDSLQYGLWVFLAGVFLLLLTVFGVYFIKLTRKLCMSCCCCIMNQQRIENTYKTQRLYFMVYITLTACAFDASAFIVLKSTNTVLNTTIPGMILLIFGVIKSLSIFYNIYSFNKKKNTSENEPLLQQQEHEDTSIN